MDTTPQPSNTPIYSFKEVTTITHNEAFGQFSVTPMTENHTTPWCEIVFQSCSSKYAGTQAYGLSVRPIHLHPGLCGGQPTMRELLACTYSTIHKELKEVVFRFCAEYGNRAPLDQLELNVDLVCHNLKRGYKEPMMVVQNYVQDNLVCKLACPGFLLEIHDGKHLTMMPATFKWSIDDNQRRTITHLRDL